MLRGVEICSSAPGQTNSSIISISSSNNGISCIVYGIQKPRGMQSQRESRDQQACMDPSWRHKSSICSPSKLKGELLQCSSWLWCSARQKQMVVSQVSRPFLSPSPLHHSLHLQKMWVVAISPLPSPGFLLSFRLQASFGQGKANCWSIHHCWLALNGTQQSKREMFKGTKQSAAKEGGEDESMWLLFPLR